MFRAEGEVWRIEFAGKRIGMHDSKGLRDLALLLRHPGRDFPATELAASTGADLLHPRAAFRDSSAELTYGLGDGGEMLDARAAAEYRRRLSELRSVMSSGTVPGYGERSIREEIEFLAAELQRAFGYGGRPRRAVAASERARKAVSNRIRAAVDRIVEAHQELGLHLRSSLQLGASCRYLPSDPVVWEV